MRSSIQTGISLALFMLLLVLLAAFIFLFQGRRTLEERVEATSSEADELQQEVEQLRANMAAAEATRQATEAELAAVESDAILLEGQLVDSQQSIDEMTGQIETLTRELAAANAQLSGVEQEFAEASQQLPIVEIILPLQGVPYILGDSVEVIIAASDALGVTAVDLMISGDEANTFTFQDEQLAIVRTSWTPALTGTITISATAVNGNGLVADPAAITIQVVDTTARNRAILEQIQTRLVESRGLAPDRPMEITFVDAALYPQAVLSFSPESLAPEESGKESFQLSAFDVITTEFSLSRARLDLQERFGPSVHDARAAAIVAVNEDGELDTDSLWQHVHQFTHFLREQSYESALDLAGSADALIAVNALYEGEAELAEFLYLSGGTLTESQVSELLDSPGGAGAAEIPAYLVEEWTFPQTAGFTFALDLYREGDDSFRLVDAAWQRPPLSTEQILHPDRYLGEDSPLVVTLPVLTSTLGSGWELVGEDVLGEFRLRQYLEQQLSEALVNTAATGWGGDRYAIYWNEADEALILVLRIVWDTLTDGSEFAALYPSYPTRLYGNSGEVQETGEECWVGRDAICLYYNGEETLIVRAPSVNTAAATIRELVRSGQRG